MKYLKTTAFVALALLLGVIGLSLVFSDLGSVESWGMRTLFAAIFFFLSGAVIGFFNPKLWMISGLIAWGGVLMGGLLTLTALRRHGSGAFSAQEPPYISAGLMMLLLPVTLALLGGFVGRLISEKRAQMS